MLSPLLGRVALSVGFCAARTPKTSRPKLTITYQGGDGNDVVITYLGFPINGPETIVYVDQNNLLNIFGKDGTSDVTAQNLIDSTGTLQTSVSDNIYGLTGFAYGIKAFNNLITIPIGDPNIIGKGEFLGIKVEQNGGNEGGIKELMILK